MTTTVHPTAVVAPNVRLGEGTVIGEYTVIGRAPRNPAVQLKDEIRDLACFVGIYPHAYAWLKDLPERVKV